MDTTGNPAIYSTRHRLILRETARQSQVGHPERQNQTAAQTDKRIISNALNRTISGITTGTGAVAHESLHIKGMAAHGYEFRLNMNSPRSHRQCAAAAHGILRCRAGGGTPGTSPVLPGLSGRGRVLVVVCFDGIHVLGQPGLEIPVLRPKGTILPQGLSS